MAANDEKIRKIAEAPLTTLLSRVSIFIIGPLCIWILSTTVDTKGTVEAIMATLSGQQKQIDDLNTWRHSFDAYAKEK